MTLMSQRLKLSLNESGFQSLQIEEQDRKKC